MAKFGLSRGRRKPIRKKRKENIIKYLIALTVVFIVLDYIVHLLNVLPEPSILPQGHFILKLIALPSIILFMVSVLKVPEKRYLLIYFISAVVLQTRYFLLGEYNASTNTLMILVHFGLIVLSRKIIEIKKVKELLK